MGHQTAKAKWVLAWCDACVFPGGGGRVHMLTKKTLMQHNIRAMGVFDYLTYLFASCVVGLTVAGEMKDIELRLMAIKKGGDRLGRGWRRALIMLTAFRRFTFLPILVAAVPMLVEFKGGDSLSVCFNTVCH